MGPTHRSVSFVALICYQCNADMCIHIRVWNTRVCEIADCSVAVEVDKRVEMKVLHQTLHVLVVKKFRARTSKYTAVCNFQVMPCYFVENAPSRPPGISQQQIRCSVRSVFSRARSRMTALSKHSYLLPDIGHRNHSRTKLSWKLVFEIGMSQWEELNYNSE